MAASTVQLQYDPSLPHQVAAIESVVDLFEGALGGAEEIHLAADVPGTLGLVELGFANPAPPDEAAFDQALLEQLRGVQARNGIEPAEKLEGRHFTVEMETGTGKTYVYLRTIFELHARYGLTKFVIAVPTVAIREGVLASLRSTSEHFSKRYATPIDHGVYDSRRLSLVRQFATSTTLQVMVMNIQAFQKDAIEGDTHDARANVINRPQDAMSGRRPIEYIQAVRPVVIIDEPQNFESDNARAAVDRLDPLCTLRYSATPKNAYNLVYRLGPVDAFQQGLVKQIEVDGIQLDQSFNEAHVRLLDVDGVGNRARVEINAGHGESTKRLKTWVKRGDDLWVKSKNRPEYTDGHIVEDIYFGEGSEALELTNQAVIALGDSSGAGVSEVQRMQVRETIRYHLDRELELGPRGVKVLSLFFLDAVADYRVYEPDGTSRLGPIGELFESELTEALGKRRYAELALGPVEELHDAYFSQDAKGRAKDSKGEGEGDRSTYDKIMKDKEQLLSSDESLRFIFSHSALREGWDNPNVFQVCTLTHARSAITRRQQIGRGLRLPVDQTGARIHDRDVARLTVIANESYEAFASGLQVDYEQETGRTWGTVERTGFAHLLLLAPEGESAHGVPDEQLGFERSAAVWETLQTAGFLDPSGKLTSKFDPTDEALKLPMPAGLERCEEGVFRVLERYDRPPVRDARARGEVRFRKNVALDSGFKAMWDDIARRTRYRVRVDSERIVRDAVKRIDDMDGVPRPLVRAEQADLEVTGAGITAGERRDGKTSVASAPAALPDILGQLQNETDLTRVTLARILRECSRLDDFRANPHAFTVQVARVLRSVLGEELIEGIEYEQIDGAIWEMRQLEPEAGVEVERYLDRLYEVESAGKSPYSHVEWESAVEERFAKSLDGDSRVRFFVKLPSWFTVDTPVGPYNPDWAICWDDDEHPRLHLVRETKSSFEEIERRGVENAKIACAREHFKAIGAGYGVATSFDDLIGQMGSG